MSKKARHIIVIGTLIIRKAHYVRKLTRRLDGSYQVELTSNLRDAKEFASNEEAEAMKRALYNPYDREFVVEETLVEWRQRQQQAGRRLC